MTYGQTQSNIKKNKRHSQTPKGQGEHLESSVVFGLIIRREAASRRQETASYAQEPTITSKTTISPAILVQKQLYSGSANSSLPSNDAVLIQTLQRPRILHKSSSSSRKRIRGQEEQEAVHPSPQTQDQPPSKRPRTLPPSGTAEIDPKKERAKDINEKTANPLEYWTLNKRWPKEYFEQDSQVRRDLEQDSWLEEQMENSSQAVKYVEANGWRLPCPIRKVPTSLRRKQSDSSLSESCDQTNREKKSAPYRTTRYTTLLEGKGSYMRKSELGVTKENKDLCQRLLESKPAVPMDSLFRDDLFEKTCRKIEDRSEARVIQDIARLIVPSAESLATYGATHLDHLIEGVNEGWTASIPVEGPRPQPDYSVGFRRSAFTDEQLRKLGPLIGSLYDTSLFVATYRMYFPFLTCEVKCGAAALDVADRQNAHSMTVAVKGVVELFKAVNREKELHREILAFSISHDHTSVRIYGHYPVIEGDKTIFYRHPIHKFDFTTLDGKEKWTAYRFTKNIYDQWMPLHIKRICSAVDDLPPDIDFELSQSASFSQSTPQSSQQSNAESILGEDDSQSSFLASQEVTPTTSFTQAERASKKPRNQRAVEK
ncbi:MAG: hypothetical protein Q9160_008801 [Pyrenula sp. 1 TL-2023]